MGRRMKRSEMVNIIEEALFHKVMDWEEENYKSDAGNIEEENYKSDAGNILLSIIEKAGMLPPDIPRSNYNGDNSPTINEWEPEDV
jgi:hypothetical protein